SLNRDPSLFQVLTKVKNDDDVEKVKQMIFQAVEDLKINSVSAERLKDVKSNIKYSFASTLDNPNRIASTLSNFINLTSDPNSLNKYYKLVDQVSSEDIKSIAEKYLVPETRNVVLLISGGN
ncbi:MAG: hypothetical protein N3A61_00400, partial [Ignavibacteria bacterium]|nr:hypothetical protein [Ignavibacteria bacterium]